MFAERYAHFSNVHTIYRDLLSGHYQPSVNVNATPELWEITEVKTTAMFLLYAYFCSMVEDDPQGVNGFRVWRATWPEEEKAIAAVEALVKPLVPGLKLFRNRLGFHGRDCARAVELLYSSSPTLARCLGTQTSWEDSQPYYWIPRPDEILADRLSFFGNGYCYPNRRIQGNL